MITIGAFSIVNVQEPAEEKENGLTIQVSPLNGGIESGEKAIHLPTGKGLRIKSVRPMYGDDSIILVKGISREKIRKKDLFIPASTGCVISNRGIFLSQDKIKTGDDYKLTGFLNKTTPPPGPEVEATIDYKNGCYTVRLSRRVAIIPAKKYYFTDSEEKEITLTAVLPDFPYDKEKTNFLTALPKERTALDVKDYLYIHMKTKGYALIPPGYQNKEFPGTKKVGTAIFTQKFYDGVMKTIEKRANGQGGLSLRDFFRVMEIPPYILDIFLDHLIFTGRYRKDKDRLLPNKESGNLNLSPMARNFLEKVRERGTDGLPLGAAKTDAEKKTYNDLAMMGLIFAGEEIFLSREALEEVSDSIDRVLKKSKKPLLLPQLAKETGISRKIIFNVMKFRESQKGSNEGKPENKKENLEEKESL